MDRTISICIPTYNRYQMTLESFAQVLGDPRVSEIVIVDDRSTDDSCEKLIEWGITSVLRFPYKKELVVDEPKYSFFDARTNTAVRLYRNSSNLDCYQNKRVAVDHCTNEWCILLDSDNIIDKTYLDKLFEIPDWSADTIYTPCFAKPHFDFRNFAGVTIHKNNVAQLMNQFSNLEVCLNACNYFVNREEYLLCFDDRLDPVTSDSIFTCYNWLRSGNQIHVLPGLEYEHRIHDGSHYQNNIHKTPAGFHQEILHKLSQL